MLVNEYYDYLRRNHDDSLAGREDMFEKMESVGYRVGRRFAERCAAIVQLCAGSPSEAWLESWTNVSNPHPRTADYRETEIALSRRWTL